MRMKNILKTILGIINTFYILIFRNIHQKKSFLYLSKFSVHSNNNLYFTHSKILNTRFTIKGTGNYISAEESLISGCQINISGEGNKLVLEEGVKLRNAIIHIRGINCIIHIGRNTTIGGARIVNSGDHNPIKIGSYCMFSDNIEIWASDTHAVLNEKNEVINKERPIIINDHVWIGSHVKVLKGVIIGSNSVVGMGSIVTKNLNRNTLNIGSPAITIRQNINWKR